MKTFNAKEKNTFKSDKITAYNSAFLFYIVFGIIIILLSFFCFFGDEVIGGSIFVVIGIGFVSFSFFIPYRYQFDGNGITMFYLCGKKQIFIKDNINCIVCKVDYGSRFGMWYEYVIDGTPKDKPCFYMKNYIVKTRKTECALKCYFKDLLIRR